MPVGSNKDNCHNFKKTGFQQPSTTSTVNDISCVDHILDSETLRNRKEPWSRLNQTEKIQKLNEYATRISKERELQSAELARVKAYLANSLLKKRLQKVKDVVYDKDLGIIKSIPNLCFNSSERRFTLKRGDRHVSTTKSLGHGRTRKKTVIEKIDTEP